MEPWDKTNIIRQRLALQHLKRFDLLRLYSDPLESRLLCELRDISEGAEDEAGCGAEPGELGGRCCTCSESGRSGSHRVPHVQSIPAREERRESIRSITPASLNPFTLISISLGRPRRISVSATWREEEEGVRGTCLEPELAFRRDGINAHLGDFYLPRSPAPV